MAWEGLQRVKHIEKGQHRPYANQKLRRLGEGYEERAKKQKIQRVNRWEVNIHLGFHVFDFTDLKLLNGNNVCMVN